MAANVKTYLAVAIHLSGSPDEGSADYVVQPDLAPNEYTTGTGADQVAQAFVDDRTLSASANETLDIFGGLSDALGRTVNFVNVKGFCIEAAATNGGNIVIGAAASHPFLAGFGGTAPTFAVAAGGRFYVENPAGWAITDATNDAIKIANSDGANPGSYTITIFGG